LYVCNVAVGQQKPLASCLSGGKPTIFKRPGFAGRTGGIDRGIRRCRSIFTPARIDSLAGGSRGSRS
jgi:hypothetical protein